MLTVGKDDNCTGGCILTFASATHAIALLVSTLRLSAVPSTRPAVWATSSRNVCLLGIVLCAWDYQQDCPSWNRSPHLGTGSPSLT